MGIPVLILGESGSGKSASLRNFKQGEIMVFNVANKPFPFREKLDRIDKSGYRAIFEEFKAQKYKRYVVDDSQYLLAFESFAKAKENGYQKFTDIALNFWNLVQMVIKDLPSDVIVYFLGHIERDNNGNEKFKTIGRMLDEKITLEGMFTIVLKTLVQDGKYMFTTQTNGMDTVKSPVGLFDSITIDNDLKFVDTKIREFYNI